MGSRLPAIEISIARWLIIGTKVPYWSRDAVREAGTRMSAWPALYIATWRARGTTLKLKAQPFFAPRLRSTSG